MNEPLWVDVTLPHFPKLSGKPGQKLQFDAVVVGGGITGLTGDGKVFKVEGKRVACARDEKGKLHTVSAICTHMGCLVHWNGAEKTWDCPCHGSRFSCDGSVLAGPAESPLEKWAAPKLQPAVNKE